MPRAVCDTKHLIGKQNQAILRSSGRPPGECRMSKYGLNRIEVLSELTRGAMTAVTATGVRTLTVKGWPLRTFVALPLPW
jgi:hypothetical protein